MDPSQNPNRAAADQAWNDYTWPERQRRFFCRMNHQGQPATAIDEAIGRKASI
jgi:hypothetical protein